VSGSPRLPGKFVWADLVTDDVPVARKFYAQLFGWQFWDMGNYTIALNDERPLCGMFQRPRPKDRVAEPRWFGYISVGSVERAQGAVTKAGGRVLAAPRQMPKRGDQAVFADPEGAVFGVVKSSAGDPEDFLAEPGEWIWIQLLSRDARKAAEFYRKVAGYDVVENTANNRLNDYVLTSKGYARARADDSERQRAGAAHLAAVRAREKRGRIGGAGKATWRQGSNRTQARTFRRQSGGDRRPNGRGHRHPGMAGRNAERRPDAMTR
jgi:predicted enzyme related to lactoylglutathione lyase